LLFILVIWHNVSLLVEMCKVKLRIVKKIIQDLI
jgi:hypothetical protein